MVDVQVDILKCFSMQNCPTDQVIDMCLNNVTFNDVTKIEKVLLIDFYKNYIYIVLPLYSCC
jgi:hypothetical protein